MISDTGQFFSAIKDACSPPWVRMNWVETNSINYTGDKEPRYIRGGIWNPETKTERTFLLAYEEEESAESFLHRVSIAVADLCLNDF